jgi:hypothetical protein
MMTQLEEVIKKRHLSLKTIEDERVFHELPINCVINLLEKVEGKVRPILRKSLPEKYSVKLSPNSKDRIE